MPLPSWMPGPRARAAALPALLTLLALLAGCSGSPDRQPDPTATRSASDTSTPVPEADNAVLYVKFRSDGPATLEVPFPTIDSCRGPAHWMAGQVEGNATAELRNATDGRTGFVVAVSGQGEVSWSSQIEPGDRCMPFRYDPWTIDPDPEGETVEVRVAAGQPQAAGVVVRVVRGTCGNATLYEGDPGAAGAGWSSLPGRSLPTSCG